MSLAQKLVEHPQREVGGSLAQERFDYQAHWGLALIFDNHGKGGDYAVAFEFHDDVVLIDSSEEPTSVHFHQIKTKSNGHWTLNDLFRRPALQDGQSEDDRPLSFMGKLFSNYKAFPNETVAMSFVSNVPLQFANTSPNFSFKDCATNTFVKFVEQLRTEHGSVTEGQASLMHFIRADLSLQDASTHAKGKLNNFVVKAHGEISFNLNGLYRAVIEDCRTRSKYTGKLNSFKDLIRFKAISHADVEKWLEAAVAQGKVPDWSEVAAEITYDIMKKMRLRSEWMKYRFKVLDAGDEAVRSVRRDIRTALVSFAEEGLSLTELTNTVLMHVRSAAAKHLSPCLDDGLIVMILYEVFQHGKQENFKALIRSLRIKRHERLKISKPAFAVKEGESGKKDRVRSEDNADSRRE